MRDFMQGDNFIKGLRLSFICLILVTPYILWSYFVSNASFVGKNLPPGKVVPFLLLDMFKIWVAMQISATAGYAWAKRPWLTGVGSFREIGAGIFLLIFFGVGIAAIELFAFDFRLLEQLLRIESVNPFISGRFVAQELILRFGIMSIAFRLFRSAPIAIIVAAAFDAVLMIEGFLSLGLDIPSGVLAIAIAKGTVMALFYGYLCATRGLIADMIVRFVVGLKALLYLLIVS